MPSDCTGVIKADNHEGLKLPARLSYLCDPHWGGNAEKNVNVEDLNEVLVMVYKSLYSEGETSGVVLCFLTQGKY